MIGVGGEEPEAKKQRRSESDSGNDNRLVNSSSRDDGNNFSVIKLGLDLNLVHENESDCFGGEVIEAIMKSKVEKGLGGLDLNLIDEDSGIGNVSYEGLNDKMRDRSGILKGNEIGEGERLDLNENLVVNDKSKGRKLSFEGLGKKINILRRNDDREGFKVDLNENAVICDKSKGRNFSFDGMGEKSSGTSDVLRKNDVVEEEKVNFNENVITAVISKVNNVSEIFLNDKLRERSDLLKRNEDVGASESVGRGNVSDILKINDIVMEERVDLNVVIDDNSKVHNVSFKGLGDALSNEGDLLKRNEDVGMAELVGGGNGSGVSESCKGGCSGIQFGGLDLNKHVIIEDGSKVGDVCFDGGLRGMSDYWKGNEVVGENDTIEEGNWEDVCFGGLDLNKYAVFKDGFKGHSVCSSTGLKENSDPLKRNDFVEVLEKENSVGEGSKEVGFDLNSRPDDDDGNEFLGCVEEETVKKEEGFDLNAFGDNEDNIDTYMMDVVSVGNFKKVERDAGECGLIGNGEQLTGDACLRTNDGDQNEARAWDSDSKDTHLDDFRFTGVKCSTFICAQDCSSSANFVAGGGGIDGGGLEPQAEVKVSKKRRRASGKIKTPTTPASLRRSSRRTTLSFNLDDNVNTEIPFTLPSPQETDVISDTPVKLELPPSSKNLDMNGIPVLDLFSVYACLRSFSTSLFLSPFSVESFVEALKCKFPTSLIESIHVSILRTLKVNVEALCNEGSARYAYDCLKSLNWELLDVDTWPIYVTGYLLFRGLERKPGFDVCRLKLLNGAYYDQPPTVKLEILRCLCDDVLEAEFIQKEVNRRTLTSEFDTDVERKVSEVATKKKRKVNMKDAISSCLTEDFVAETADPNSDDCCLCKMDGSLICCDGCPAAYHMRCVGVSEDVLPEGDWYCPECVLNRSELLMKPSKSLRGADTLGIDPHGRIFFSTFGYLLVSDSCEPEASFFYYNRNDLNTVIKVLQSSGTSFAGILNAISTNWDFPIDLPLDKGPVSLQANNEYQCLVRDIPCSVTSMPLVSSPPLVMMEIQDETKTRKTSDITDAVAYQHSKVAMCVNKAGSMTVDEFIDGSCHISSLEGFAETSSKAETLSTVGFSSHNHGDSNPNIERNVGAMDLSQTLTVLTPGIKATPDIEFHSGDYVNYYTFGQTASLVVEELMKKSSNNEAEESKKSAQELITLQMMVISKSTTKFCWSGTQASDTNDVRNENCGWCFSCRTSDESRDCLFNISNIKPSAEGTGGGALCLHPVKNRKDHLHRVVNHILFIEDRISGLLSGPWHTPHFSKQWRKGAVKSEGVASLKCHLLTLESNLRRIALSTEWFKQVDNDVTMGSASHLITSSAQISSSKLRSSKKRVQLPDSQSSPASKAAKASDIFWWRGGKLSRQLFNWKVLPRSLASKGARQAGCKKIPGIFYPDNLEFARRSKCVAWRAAAEISKDMEQLACQVKELDLNIRWDTLENTQVVSHLSKEARTIIRQFKKVSIRRKCVEGKTVKYLLDFGKRKTIPDIVTENGVMLEISASERKKYWLDEAHVPLHILKAYEEKKLIQRSNKSETIIIDVGGCVATTKPSTKKGLSYILSKGQKPEFYQCGHCKKDVLSRDAVSCEECKCFFHTRHVKKLKGTATCNCIYTCDKCLDTKHMRKSPHEDKKLIKKSVSQDKKSMKKPVVQNKKGIKKSAFQNKEGTKKFAKKPKAKKRKVQSQKIEISTRVLRPRIGVKKVKYVSLRSSKVGGAKRTIKVKPKKALPKKSKTEVRWQKGKRTVVSHAYWFNGIRFSKTPFDARAKHFREKELLHFPVEYSSSDLVHPTCSLCCEAGYKSNLIYVKCESCQDWFHGDTFGITLKNSKAVIGFRCSRCLNRDPSVCFPFEDTAGSRLHLSGSLIDKKQCAIEVSLTELRLPEVIGGSIELVQRAVDDSLALQNTCEPMHIDQMTTEAVVSDSLTEDQGLYSVSDSILKVGTLHS